MVNKSVKQITRVYSKLDRIMKSAAAKEAALEKMRRVNQDEDSGIIELTPV